MKPWEFVYLDEVATQSLTATLDGGIIQESKETNRVSFYSEKSGGVNLPGGKLGTSAGREVTRGIELHRQEVAESHFARLDTLLRENSLLPVRTGDHRGSVTDHASIGLLRKAFRSIVSEDRWLAWLQDKGIATPSDSLSRGTVMELEVDIERPHLYMLAEAMGSFAEAMSSLREHMPEGATIDPGEVESLKNMVLWMRGGLVPLTGEVSSHVVAERGDQTLLVHQSGLDLLPDRESWNIDTFNIAGFCELDSFWQEPVRVFMEEAGFNCLVRLEDPEISSKWDGLDHLEIFDALGVDVRRAARTAVNKMEAVRDRHEAPAPLDLETVLETYNGILAEACSEEESSQALERIQDTQWAKTNPADVPPRARRRLQNKIEEEYSLEDKDLDLQSLRRQAFQEHGRNTTGDVLAAQNDLKHKEDEAVREALRVQFIGIYW